MRSAMVGLSKTALSEWKVGDADGGVCGFSCHSLLVCRVRLPCKIIFLW